MQNPSPIVTVAHRTELGVSDVRYGLGALSTVPRKAATNALAPVRQKPTNRQPVIHSGAIGEVRAPEPVTLLAAPAGLNQITTRGLETIPRYVSANSDESATEPGRAAEEASPLAFAEPRESVFALFVSFSPSPPTVRRRRHEPPASPVQPASPAKLQPGRRTSRSP